MEPAIGRITAHLGGQEYSESPYYDYDPDGDEYSYYLYPDELESSRGRGPAKADSRNPDSREIWPASLDIHRSMDRDRTRQQQTEEQNMMEPVELDIVYTKQQWQQIQR